VWVGLRDTPQVPLRGPAQPLAAVRSDACEAMPRKQCALTHVATVLLEGTWPLQQTGTVVPAAGRQPLEMCPGALQAGIGPL